MKYATFAARKALLARRLVSYLTVTLSTLVATEALAQAVNLTGQYRCVQLCQSGLVGNPAYVTQNGWSINLLNEAGTAARAWADWFSPTRIWVPNWNEGAVFSPDGMVIQFDRGTIWQRDFGSPQPLQRGK